MPHPDVAAPPRPGAARFWLATALLLLLVAATVVPAVGAFRDQAAAIAAVEGRREAQSRILGRADSIAAELKALEAHGKDGSDLLSGATDAIAGAELQALVAAAVKSVGGKLVSTQSLNAEAAGPGFKRVVARATATITSRQLRDLLHGLEAGQPRLLIIDLALRATDARGAVLELTLDVAGFRAEGAQ